MEKISSMSTSFEFFANLMNPQRHQWCCRLHGYISTNALEIVRKMNIPSTRVDGGFIFNRRRVSPSNQGKYANARAFNANESSKVEKGQIKREDQYEIFHDSKAGQ